MNRIPPIFAIAALVCLAGCPVTQVNRLPQSSPLRQAAPISAIGDFRHIPSGFVFPTEVAAFQRVVLLQYDSAGLDISAGYNDALPNCPVALTIYVYPTPRMTFVGADPELVGSMEAQWLDGAYSDAKRQIVKAHTGASLESEDATAKDGLPRKKAVYSIDNTKSELMVSVVHHSWFLKYRVTYPAPCSEQARSAIDSFNAVGMVQAR